MAEDLTSAQNFALSLLFDALKVDRINRTPEEYEQIKAQLPNLKQAHHLINEHLREFAEAGFFSNCQICRFKAGDKIIRYEPYPTSISIETVRLALNAAGWRAQRGERGAASY